MLGDIIYEQKGKVSGHRVLDTEGPKVETTITNTGILNGIEVTDIVTFWTIPIEDKQPNTVYEEGQGVITSKDGKQIATWKGYGIGRSHGSKRIDRGSVFFKSSTNGELAFLNNKIGVFEFESDENGNTHGKIWEWK
ncbi:MAG: hypothetical protein R3321_07980 [Nitrososphaeraceae archaeon]|nr:hypothetical protein [Nitrososphaeraceae archaeon]